LEHNVWKPNIETDQPLFIVILKKTHSQLLIKPQQGLSINKKNYVGLILVAVAESDRSYVDETMRLTDEQTDPGEFSAAKVTLFCYLQTQFQKLHLR
jgi:hypothetical protein